ncbi:MAG: hypothetical protein KDE26_17735, partial [Bacteroidetes bacterium]|nr:hypothetical protein [Bacteroidota bacterium]
SANGGYISGMLGKLFTGTAEVTLRKPPPLGKEMQIIMDGTSHLHLMDGETLIAESQTATLDLGSPPSPDYEEAVAASKKFSGFENHAFPSCFVCGPQRAVGDGLRIFAGNVPGKSMVASPWTPDFELSDDNGKVHEEFIWAALDCPGAFAAVEVYDPIVLGRFTTKILQPVMAGEPHIVIGWKEGEEGRKYYSGTAIYTADQKLCAIAKAIWIRLR